VNSQRDAGGSSFVGANYVCPATGQSLPGFTSCTKTSGFTSSSGVNTVTFTDADCSYGLPTGSDCIATFQKSAYGDSNGAGAQDEDWRAYGPLDSGGASFSFRTSEAETGDLNVKVNYMCGSLDSGYTKKHCSHSQTSGTSRGSYTFSASDCGGALPDSTCVPFFRRTASDDCNFVNTGTADYSDEDWNIHPTESYPYKVSWWPSCASLDIAVDYVCPA
jgi:hypothetical protein